MPKLECQHEWINTYTFVSATWLWPFCRCGSFDFDECHVTACRPINEARQCFILSVVHVVWTGDR